MCGVGVTGDIVTVMDATAALLVNFGSTNDAFTKVLSGAMAPRAGCRSRSPPR
jgi:hypothetical protein